MSSEPRLPVPCVLVIGDFRKNSIGFAEKAWRQICHEYEQEGLNFGPFPALKEGETPLPYDDSDVPVTGYTAPENNPALFPIPVSDYGQAFSARFEFYLYQLFRRFNILGVISCCTAENTKGLAKALQPIDVPVLLALDSTLSGTESFTFSETQNIAPNVLQLIVNNSLQAQAILGKVSLMLNDTSEYSAHFFCFPEDDEYVKDLKHAVQSNLENNKKIEIQDHYFSDPAELELKRKKAIVVCLGYFEALQQLDGKLKKCDLLLSDGFDDSRVEDYLRKRVDAYHLIRPVYEPLDHALDAYRVLNEAWRRSIQPQTGNVQMRLKGWLSTVRDLLENEYPHRYKFGGATNQRGGYFAERISTKRRGFFESRRRSRGR